MKAKSVKTRPLIVAVSKKIDFSLPRFELSKVPDELTAKPDELTAKPDELTFKIKISGDEAMLIYRLRLIQFF